MTMPKTRSRDRRHQNGVTVSVTDVEEDGVVTLSAMRSRVSGTPLTATLEDGDGGVTGAELAVGAVRERADRVDQHLGGHGQQLHDNRRRMRSSSCGRRSPTRTGAAAARTRRRSRTAARLRARTNAPPFPSTETGQRTVPENTRAAREHRRARGGRGPGERQADVLAERHGRRRLHHRGGRRARSG